MSRFIVHWQNYTKPTEAVFATEMNVVGNSVIFTEDNQVKAVYNLHEIRKVVKDS